MLRSIHIGPCNQMYSLSVDCCNWLHLEHRKMSNVGASDNRRETSNVTFAPRFIEKTFTMGTKSRRMDVRVYVQRMRLQEDNK